MKQPCIENDGGDNDYYCAISDGGDCLLEYLCHMPSDVALIAEYLGTLGVTDRGEILTYDNSRFA